jgi:DNA-binding NtrC family response regulator
VESVIFDAAGAVRPLPEARALASDEFERQYLDKVFALAERRVHKAAELANVSRRFMRKLVTKHGMRGDDHDDE